LNCVISEACDGRLLLEQVGGAGRVAVAVRVGGRGVVGGRVCVGGRGVRVDRGVVGGERHDGVGTPARGARVVHAARQRGRDLAGRRVVVVTEHVVHAANGERAGHEGGEEGDE